MTPERVATAFAVLSGEAVLEVRRLSGGSSVPFWQVTTAAERYAVRSYADKHLAYAQAQLLSYMAQQGFPASAVTFVGTYRAQHLLALSWVGGRTLAEALQLQPERAERLGRTGEVQAQLHALPVPPELRAALPVIGVPGQPDNAPVSVHPVITC